MDESQVVRNSGRNKHKASASSGLGGKGKEGMEGFVLAGKVFEAANEGEEMKAVDVSLDSITSKTVKQLQDAYACIKKKVLSRNIFPDVIPKVNNSL